MKGHNLVIATLNVFLIISGKSYILTSLNIFIYIAQVVELSSTMIGLAILQLVSALARTLREKQPSHRDMDTLRVVLLIKKDTCNFQEPIFKQIRSPFCKII